MNYIPLLSFKFNFNMILSPKLYVIKWDRKKHFLLKGVFLDEFLHGIIYESKVYNKKFSILLYVFQSHFEYCKIEHNQTIYFLFLVIKKKILERTYKLSQNFFLVKWKIFWFCLWKYEMFLSRCAQLQRWFYITSNHS